MGAREESAFMPIFEPGTRFCRGLTLNETSHEGVGISDFGEFMDGEHFGTGENPSFPDIPFFLWPYF